MELDLQEYIQSILHPHLILPANPLQSESLGFQIVIYLKLKWSSGSVRSFQYNSPDSICLWPLIFFYFWYLCSKIVHNCYIHSIIHMQINIFILTGKNILLKVIWSCTY